MRSNRLFWVELVGVVSIVASLLAVVSEMRTNTATIAAQAVAELNASTNETIRLLGSDEGASLLAAFIKAQEAAGELTQDDHYRLYMYCWSVGNSMESAWTFREKDVIDDEDYLIYRKGTCDWMRMPQCASFREQGIDLFNPRFLDDSRKWCQAGASVYGL